MATLTETFTNIANSIRLKTETTDKITPENMPSMIEGITTGGNVAELSITSNGTYRAPEGIDGYTPVIVNVPQDGAPPASAFVISGNCKYKFAFTGWNWFLNMYSNQITTKDIGPASSMFYFNTGIKEVPFDINIGYDSVYEADNMFCYSNIEKAPNKINGKITNFSNMFSECSYLTNIPEGILDGVDWDYFENNLTSYTGSMSSMFNGCRSLKRLPNNIINHANRKCSYSYYLGYGGFSNCYVLEEINDLGVVDDTTWNGDGFWQGFKYTHRLKKLTFKTNEDGTPKIVKWKSQVIDISERVGFTLFDTNITKYKSGLTDATRITDDVSYQTLKDNPDSWTTKEEYSRYNKTSALETIATLPDTSAYLASAGGTNTIKFKGICGSKTDGGAINTMTEEEIAVATAKGWTVSFV